MPEYSTSVLNCFSLFSVLLLQISSGHSQWEKIQFPGHWSPFCSICVQICSRNRLPPGIPVLIGTKSNDLTPRSRKFSCHLPWSLLPGGNCLFRYEHLFYYWLPFHSLSLRSEIWSFRHSGFVFHSSRRIRWALTDAFSRRMTRPTEVDSPISPMVLRRISKAADCRISDAALLTASNIAFCFLISFHYLPVANIAKRLTTPVMPAPRP